ncbi:MAG: NYN domain-containing protein [Candidatus Saccharimonadales bacterium]
MFIGLVNNNQKLYTQLQAAGFILVFKPTVQYFQDGKQTVKGNVDAELVLHAAAIQYAHYDKAIIVSNDGDFACLIEYLVDKNKLLHIFTPNRNYSKLLKPFSKYIVELSQLKKSLEYKKTGIGGRSKP